MVQYIIRRLLWGVVLLIAVMAITFALFYLLPNVNPAELRAGRNSSPKIIHEISVSLGTDKPVYTQFWLYLKHLIFHFDLGQSYYSDAPVKSLIFDRLPATISLTFGAVFVWLMTGIPIGIISATMRRRPVSPRLRWATLLIWLPLGLIPLITLIEGNHWWQIALPTWVILGIPVVWMFTSRTGTALDRFSMGGALVFVSAPVYWLGLLVLFFFSADIGNHPVSFLHGAGSYTGLTNDPWQWFESLLMPWFVLAATSAAIYARLLRGSLVEVMGEDYIRTARAKGLPERTVVLKHGVRSAITPLVTVLGLDIATLLGGAVLVETVFDIPGIGRLNYDAITHADFPIVQGTIVLAALFIIVANIIVDIAYAYLDPRVRYS